MDTPLHQDNYKSYTYVITLHVQVVQHIMIFLSITFAHVVKGGLAKGGASYVSQINLFHKDVMISCCYNLGFYKAG